MGVWKRRSEGGVGGGVGGRMYDERGEDNERIGRREGKKEEDVVHVERKAKKREKGGGRRLIEKERGKRS